VNFKTALLVLTFCLYAQIAVSQDRHFSTAQPHVLLTRAVISDQVSSTDKVGDSENGNGKGDARILEQGRVAFEASCTSCHEASRALDKSMSYAQWLETIRKMAAKKDAEIRSSDFEAIAQYLVVKASASHSKQSTSNDDKKNGDNANKDADPSLVASGQTAFNRSCLKCHDAERSLSKSKSQSEWLSTVRRMAAKDGAEISSSDFTSIATYLASLGAASDKSGKAGAKESGGWTLGTSVSTLYRGTNDAAFVENPGFFADVWVTASHQSSGAWGATVTACTSCHSTNSGSNAYSLEILEASATVDIRKLLTHAKAIAARNYH